MTSAAEVAELLGHAEAVEVELDLPDWQDGEVIVLGKALSVVYEDGDGDKYEHRFGRKAVIMVGPGAVLIRQEGLEITDLGIEEE